MPRSVKPRRGTPPVLWIVAGLFLASGGLRIVLGAAPAIAFAEEQLAPEPPPAETTQVTEAPPLDPVLAALQERETRLAERELAFSDRMQALTLAEAELTERLAELQAAEESLRAALALSETANETDIARLTAVYENMKPADAAGLFEEMAPEFASGFLVRMQPESAAAILAGLDPQTAYSISVIIAGRNANALTE